MPDSIPGHVAIIMDGNGRWAKRQGFAAALRGHEEGIKRFREISDAGFEAGVRHLTFWAGSADNLTKRSFVEVAGLTKLFERGLQEELELKRLVDRGVRFRVVGDWKNALRERGIATGELEKLICAHEKQTCGFGGRGLTILFGYDGQREILDAADSLQAEALQRFHPLITSKRPRIDENMLLGHLLTGFLPPVDLVIRTGEENDRQYHESAGFMMWHAANAVKQFPDVLWPEFTKERFFAELELYAVFERRFGARPVDFQGHS